MRPAQERFHMLYRNKNFLCPQATQLTEEILKLIAHKTNSQPKLSGRGFIVRCPAHEDKKASLSIAPGYDGRVLIKCFCGCALQDVCDAIGIKIRDLFPKKKWE